MGIRREQTELQVTQSNNSKIEVTELIKRLPKKTIDMKESIQVRNYG